MAKMTEQQWLNQVWPNQVGGVFAMLNRKLLNGKTYAEILELAESCNPEHDKFLNGGHNERYAAYRIVIYIMSGLCDDIGEDSETTKRVMAIVNGKQYQKSSIDNELKAVEEKFNQIENIFAGLNLLKETPEHKMNQVKAICTEVSNIIAGIGPNGLSEQDIANCNDITARNKNYMSRINEVYDTYKNLVVNRLDNLYEEANGIYREVQKEIEKTQLEENRKRLCELCQKLIDIIRLLENMELDKKTSSVMKKSKCGVNEIIEDINNVVCL